MQNFYDLPLHRDKNPVSFSIDRVRINRMQYVVRGYHIVTNDECREVVENVATSGSVMNFDR